MDENGAARPRGASRSARSRQSKSCLNKWTLAERVAARAGCSKYAGRRLVEALLAEIELGLREHGRIKLKGFATLVVSPCKPRSCVGFLAARGSKVIHPPPTIRVRAAAELRERLRAREGVQA